MHDPREPKFQWGQPVVAATDLYNDGSLPDAPEDILLVCAGGRAGAWSACLPGWGKKWTRSVTIRVEGPTS